MVSFYREAPDEALRPISRRGRPRLLVGHNTQGSPDEAIAETLFAPPIEATRPHGPWEFRASVWGTRPFPFETGIAPQGAQLLGLRQRAASDA